MAVRRLPALRDQPLHRRPRLVRRVLARATACSCPARSSSRSAASTTASRCPAVATPTSSCSSAWAAVARRHRRVDPRRGFVPPGARRNDDQRRGARRPTEQDRSPTASTTRSCAAALAWPGQARALRRRRLRRPAARRTRSRRHDRARLRRRRDDGSGRCARPSPTPIPEELRTAVSRGLLGRACPGRTPRGSAGPSRTPRPTSSCTRSCSRSVRPDWIVETGDRRGPSPVPGVDLRAPRSRPGAVDRRRGRERLEPSTRGSPTSRTRAPDEERSFAQVAGAHRRRAHALVILGSRAAVRGRLAQ